MTEARRRTLLMYCQHSLGLGHLRRSWAIASALAGEFQVVLLNGGAPVSGLSAPVGIEEIQLPPLALVTARITAGRQLSWRVP